MANYKIEYSDGFKFKVFQLSDNKDLSFKLYDIDNITSQIPNEESFMIYLNSKKSGFYVSDARLIYGRDKREKEIIYNSQLLYEVSSICKKNQSNIVDLNLIKSFIKRLENYVLNDNAMFDYDLVFPLRLKLALENYKLYYNKRLTKDLINVVDDIKKELKDYSKFREVVLWEQKYQKLKNDELEELANSINHEIMQIEKEEEEARNKVEYSQMTLEEYIESKNIEDKTKIMCAVPSCYDEEEKWLLEASKNIKDQHAKEIFLKTGDAESVLYALGEEKVLSLSENDKTIIFGKNYEQYTLSRIRH